MAYRFVRYAEFSVSTGGNNTFSCVPITTTAGDWLIVVAFGNNSPTANITDTAGNFFQMLTLVNSGFGGCTYIGLCPNCVGGTTTVTINGAFAQAIAVFEYAGLGAFLGMVNLGENGNPTTGADALNPGPVAMPYGPVMVFGFAADHNQLEQNPPITALTFSPGTNPVPFISRAQIWAEGGSFPAALAQDARVLNNGNLAQTVAATFGINHTNSLMTGTAMVFAEASPSEYQVIQQVDAHIGALSGSLTFARPTQPGSAIILVLGGATLISPVFSDTGGNVYQLCGPASVDSYGIQLVASFNSRPATQVNFSTVAGGIDNACIIEVTGIAGFGGGPIGFTGGFSNNANAVTPPSTLYVNTVPAMILGICHDENFPANVPPVNAGSGYTLIKPIWFNVGAGKFSTAIEHKRLMANANVPVTFTANAGNDNLTPAGWWFYEYGAITTDVSVPLPGPNSQNPVNLGIATPMQFWRQPHSMSYAAAGSQTLTGVAPGGQTGSTGLSGPQVSRRPVVNQPPWDISGPLETRDTSVTRDTR